jgi:hypothetical protein
MVDPGFIERFEALLHQAAADDCTHLQVGYDDAIAFRLEAAEDVFRLAEARLQLRDPGTYEGYASARQAVEAAHPERSIKEKVETCARGNPAWEGDFQVLYSAELEAWMDLSYADPLTLGLYRQALDKGIPFHVTMEGPFSETFVILLLEKNGFDQFTHKQPEGSPFLLTIHPLKAKRFGHALLEEGLPEQRCHALSEGQSLAARIANGVMVKERRESRIRTPEASERYLHDVGFRLIGPILTLLFQELEALSEPVSFSGRGSGFLTTFGQTLHTFWPWLPEIVPDGDGQHKLSVFPENKSDRSLLPSLEGSSDSLISLSDLDPQDLLAAPLHAFIASAMTGSQAAHIQASASAFILEFARSTRGLHLPLDREDVMRHWKQQVLSPRPEFIRTLSKNKVLPDYQRSRMPWTLLRLIREGTWPTATYFTSCRLNRWVASLFAREKTRSIKHWHDVFGEPLV